MLRLSSGLGYLKQTTQLGFFLHAFTDAQIRHVQVMLYSTGMAPFRYVI